MSHTASVRTQIFFTVFYLYMILRHKSGFHYAWRHTNQKTGNYCFSTPKVGCL